MWAIAALMIFEEWNMVRLFILSLADTIGFITCWTYDFLSFFVQCKISHLIWGVFTCQICSNQLDVITFCFIHQILADKTTISNENVCISIFMRSPQFFSTKLGFAVNVWFEVAGINNLTVYVLIYCFGKAADITKMSLTCFLRMVPSGSTGLYIVVDVRVFPPRMAWNDPVSSKTICSSLKRVK